MKITGGINYIKFDFENGYVVKAEGEMLSSNKFLVYTNTIKHWEYPHEKEILDPKDISRIRDEISKMMNEKTVQIEFID